MTSYFLSSRSALLPSLLSNSSLGISRYLAYVVQELYELAVQLFHQSVKRIGSIPGNLFR
jgi:hypothetical protein